MKIKNKIISIILVLLLIAINCNFASVLDNDGSSFVTKAEFDSLKNSFQAQIDEYNTSIDSKIDEAILSYLLGVSSSSTNEMSPLLSTVDKVYCVDEDNVWQWKGGQLHFDQEIRWNVAGSGYGTSNGGGWHLFTRESPDATYFHKLIIEKKKNKRNIDTWYWTGYSEECTEEIINKSVFSEKPGHFAAWARVYLGGLYNLANDGDLGSETNFLTKDLISGGYNSSDKTGAASWDMPGSAALPAASLNRAVFEWGVPKYEHIITYRDAPANFSVKGSDQTRYWRKSNSDPSGYKTGDIDSQLTCRSQLSKVTWLNGYINGATATGAYIGSFTPRNGANTYRFCFGFHSTIKKFSSICCSDRSDLTVNLKSSSVEFNDVHPYEGWPLFVCEKDCTYQFNVEFEDKTKDYILYANDNKFSLVNYKSTTAVSGNQEISLSKDKDYVRELEIKNGEGTVYIKPKSEFVLWLKWKVKGGNGGGCFIQPSKIIKMTNG